MSPDGPDRHSILITLSGDVGRRMVDGSIHRLRGNQPQLVLSYLLLEGRTVERYELAELLWGERVPEHWAGAIRGVLTKIRVWLADADLPGAELIAESGLVRLDLPEGAVSDIAIASEAITMAQRAIDAGDPAVGGREASRASALLEGPFLPQGDGDWVARQRDRFEALAGSAARLGARALLDGGDADRAADLSADRVRRDPLDETAHHLLIEALLAGGRRADALRAYADLTTVLASELGIAPSEETRALLAGVSTIAAQPGLAREVASAAPSPETSRQAVSREPVPVEPFVGRRAEMGRLLEAWTAANAVGRPCLETVRGDAGIGKTRLAEEFGFRTTAGGAQVFWGRCRANSGLAFEPIVELLSEAIRADPGVLARIGPRAGHLTPLLPDLRLPVASLPLDPVLERTQLFGAVTAVMAEVAATPTVWVIDDLQWASPDTAALLEVVLERVSAPVFVLATYRGRSPSIEAMLARLQRTVHAGSVGLQGLEAEDLREVVRVFHPSADAAQDELVRDLHERTGGNAFFVAEIAREARRAGTGFDPRRIPDSARQWIERRAAALDPATSAVFDLCAVIGVDVDLDLLGACYSGDEGALSDACDHLLDQGLLVESEHVNTLSFPHLISRDAIYERLRSPRRLQLHRRVVQVIEAQVHRPGRDRELAHHLARLGPEAASRAAVHALAAGHDALRQSAWVVAGEQFALAAELGEGNTRLRSQALIGLGRSRYRSRDLPGASVALVEAITTAREGGHVNEMAEAALQLVGRAGRGAAIDMTDGERESLLREVLAGLEGSVSDAEGDGSFVERAALMGEVEGELALALLFTDAADERRSLVERALIRARRADPVVPRHLARALLGTRIAKLHPVQLADRLADEAEILAMPVDELPAEHVIAALAYQHEDRLLTGDREGARTSLAQLLAAVDAHPHPYWAWVAGTWTALGHLIDGDLDEAEASAVAAARLQLGGEGESTACLGVNLISIRLWQGRSDEVIDLVGRAVSDYGHVPCYRAVLALCAAKAGEWSEAETAYRFFAADEFGGIPLDTNRFLTFAVLADVAVDLGDIVGARDLAVQLARYRGLQVLLNCYGGGGAYWGPASLQLARLAALLGRSGEADELFAEARRQADEFYAPRARAMVDEATAGTADITRAAG